MVVYIALKEDGEWKLVQSGRTASSYVHTTSKDKGDVISLGNSIMSNHALDKDEYAVFVIRKASGGIQSVKARNKDMGRHQVQAWIHDQNPFDRYVEILIEHQNTQTEKVVVGYFVTRSAAEKAAVHIRNRL